eukprot:6416632-Pyramimonas_sp.AAC.2
MMDAKSTSVNQLTGGIEMLLKKNKVKRTTNTIPSGLKRRFAKPKYEICCIMGSNAMSSVCSKV